MAAAKKAIDDALVAGTVTATINVATIGSMG